MYLYQHSGGVQNARTMNPWFTCISVLLMVSLQESGMLTQKENAYVALLDVARPLHD